MNLSHFLLVTLLWLVNNVSGSPGRHKWVSIDFLRPKTGGNHDFILHKMFISLELSWYDPFKISLVRSKSTQVTGIKGAKQPSIKNPWVNTVSTTQTDVNNAASLCPSVPRLSHPNGRRGGFTRPKAGQSLSLFNICWGLIRSAAVMRDWALHANFSTTSPPCDPHHDTTLNNQPMNSQSHRKTS